MGGATPLDRDEGGGLGREEEMGEIGAAPGRDEGKGGGDDEVALGREEGMGVGRAGMELSRKWGWGLGRAGIEAGREGLELDRVEGNGLGRDEGMGAPGATERPTRSNGSSSSGS